MSWNNRVNNNYREERPSTPIYALRKEGRLEEAYQLALRLYQQDSADDDINKAFSWVLIDLCKKFISEYPPDELHVVVFHDIVYHLGIDIVG